jgi:hypothetical protein
MPSRSVVSLIRIVSLPVAVSTHAPPLPSEYVNGNVGRPLGGGGTGRQRKGRIMGDSDEFAAMSDPDFLAERKRVRETLEPLTERYRVINIEFDRRAGVQWASASRG